jgi:hypothetical protein
MFDYGGGITPRKCSLARLVNRCARHAFGKRFWRIIEHEMAGICNFGDAAAGIAQSRSVRQMTIL